MGPVVKSFKLLKEKMGLLSLRLGFLSPKLSTQGVITCFLKLHYSVAPDQPVNSFLRSVDGNLGLTHDVLWTHLDMRQVGSALAAPGGCILTHGTRCPFSMTLFLHRHTSLSLSCPPHPKKALEPQRF